MCCLLASPKLAFLCDVVCALSKAATMTGSRISCVEYEQPYIGHRIAGMLIFVPSCFTCIDGERHQYGAVGLLEYDTKLKKVLPLLSADIHDSLHKYTLFISLYMSLLMDRNKANDFVHQVNDYQQLQLYSSAILN